MIYVLPTWQEKIGRIPDFDEASYQLRLFDGYSEQGATILLPEFLPRLRKDLVQHDISPEIEILSLFDEIQNVNNLFQQTINVYDFDWPPSASIQFGDRFVHVYVNGQRYAKIMVDEALESFVWMELYQDGTVIKRIDFDDRGFSSRVVEFESNGVISQVYYLMPSGLIAMKHNFNNGQPGNLELAVPFAGKTNFDSLENLQAAFINSFGDDFEKNDVVAWLNSENYTMIKNSGIHSKMIAALPINNNQWIDETTKDDLFATYQRIVVPKKADVQNIFQEKTDQLVELPPFETYWGQQGKSPQIPEVNLIWHVKQVDKTIANAIPFVDELLNENEDVNVQFLVNFTEVADELKNHFSAENKDRLTFTSDGDEEAIKQLFEFGRIFIDLSQNPEVFTQTLSLSSGIPQIIMHPTIYNQVHESTTLISSPEQLGDALKHYVNTLNNWAIGSQGALTGSMNFAPEKLIEKWEKVFSNEATPEEIEKTANHRKINLG